MRLKLTMIMSKKYKSITISNTDIVLMNHALVMFKTYMIGNFKKYPNLSIDEIADLINLINDEKWNCNNNCDT